MSTQEFIVVLLLAPVCGLGLLRIGRKAIRTGQHFLPLYDESYYGPAAKLAGGCMIAAGAALVAFPFIALVLVAT